MSAQRFQGKVAVVTGGNSGIGLGVAKAYAREGAQVAITGRNEKTLETAAKEIGAETLAIQSDAGKIADIEASMKKIKERFGRIDAMFVNAGVAKLLPFEQVTEAIFDETVNINMTVSNGVLNLQPREGKGTSGRHRPIDRFLESLAQDQGHRAIGVILSGAATDGTVGLNAIKAEGGITFAQNETAKFESMPRSAVAAGSVDYVLSPEEIAHEIPRIIRNLDFRMPPARTHSKKQPPEISYEDGFGDILRILRKSTDVDFAHYKPTTVERRILRRMILNKQTELKQYRQFIEATPGEVEALYQDLLISVTGFFRNPEAFEALKERVFPEVLRQRDSHETVRVWVYGCSTGEEAYSIAMAFMEYCRNRDTDVPMQIFATDVNETAIERSRAGIYSKATTDVSPERLRRFFTEVDGHYQINKAIRDMCVFAKQNLITDPPFSHMDLVSCRNVLIYLDAVTQRRIIPMFHYALKAQGLLMLGASESIGGSTDFEPVDQKYKIYRKKPAAPRFDFVKLPGIERLTSEHSPSRRNPAKIDVLDGDTYAQREADRILLSNYRPAAVLINKDMEILQYRGPVGTYLEPASGKATHNLLKMSRSGLLLPLRKVIQEATRTGRTAMLTEKESIELRRQSLCDICGVRLSSGFKRTECVRSRTAAQLERHLVNPPCGPFSGSSYPVLFAFGG